MLVEISDPVARVSYAVNTQDKVAHKRTIAPPQTRPFTRAMMGHDSRSREIPDAARPKLTDENLGSQTIEGLVVEGTRHTMTWPAGSAMGNDRPITSVIETWTSPDLKIVVLSQQTDPRNGEHTVKLVNINRGEPDAGLFQPPAGYRVVESGPPAPR